MAYEFQTSEQRSALMRKIKSNNTASEIKLRKMLWNLGLRYRINVKSLPGKPDIVFAKRKLAIFIDGEFWHGYKWNEKKPKIKDNADYWIKKIERNMERDRINSEKLIIKGYRVVRFWDGQIKRDIENCVKEILDLLQN